jgi:hypothetical protein
MIFHNDTAAETCMHALCNCRSSLCKLYGIDYLLHLVSYWAMQAIMSCHDKHSLLDVVHLHPYNRALVSVSQCRAYTLISTPMQQVLSDPHTTPHLQDKILGCWALEGLRQMCRPPQCGRRVGWK